MEEAAIRTKIRHQLQANRLPQHLPPTDTSPAPAIRTGQGTGEPCAACEEPIAPGAPLEECAYPSGQVFRFHGLCYKYWNEEREVR